ncbi:mitochondrial fission ELM1 family protein [Agrobacterium larrymoorei]|uniref:ELM1/GtrOC1 family putative glycosyltransferase n=1 Tax=Agrobacterium larrymoorei TaxID=160699 RepID=A0AAF0H9L1_9HYPH|nr:ELM1/GtrOC1 family putative glycosyltransferase [Agrobacterium larrymoorei]WHA40389.1 ELM1/GtrOC1 family putative glycosyltransferase [Agrobacterium larrymoorei]
MEMVKSWVVSEPKIGTLSQCLAVARYFDACPIEKSFVHKKRLLRIFDPPIFRRSEPRPGLVVSCGYRSEPRVMRIKKAFKGAPVTVHLQVPRIEGYDLVFVSRHDWMTSYEDRADYHQMLGVPHRFTPDFWEHNRSEARAKYALEEDQKLAVVLLGGTNGAYDYDAAAIDTIKQSIESLVVRDWKVLVSVSRRSSDETQSQIASIASRNVVVWDRKSENPYVDYLASADAFLVAKDSVTMPCEALSTGKPVYSLNLTHIPGKRLEKFERFHADLTDTLKLTRNFEGDLLPYDYMPPNEAQRIAGIVKTYLKEKRVAASR